MRLTREEQGERLDRFRHLKPCRSFLGQKPCGASLSGTGHICDRERGHRGPHAAHGFMREILAVWTMEEGASGDRSSGSSGSRAVQAARDSRRRAVRRRGSEDGDGLPSRVAGRLLRLLASPEQLALLLLFLGLVVFALDVARRIVEAW